MTVNGVLAGLVSRGGSDVCAKVGNNNSILKSIFPTQENVYDIYAEVAFFMSWINETILSMGGMQACGLTLEKTPTDETPNGG